MSYRLLSFLGFFLSLAACLFFCASLHNYLCKLFLLTCNKNYNYLIKGGIKNMVTIGGVKQTPGGA